MIKRLLGFALVMSPAIWVACTAGQEDPKPDCSVSGLIVSVSSATAAECSTPGSLTVAATGGTSPLVFSVDGANFQSSAAFNGLSAGSYTITVKDANNCTATVNATVPGEVGSVSLSVSVSSSTDCGSSTGSVTLNATGGEGNYTYSVDGGAFGPSSTFQNLARGNHTFVAKDANGCTASLSVVVQTNISLEADIMPIITANCATSSSCHKSGASGRSVLETKTQVVAVASSIKAQTQSGAMPRGGSLTAAQKAAIACWVDDGAPNN